MRINIFEAGLATFLLAGRGFLPKADAEPKNGPEAGSPVSAVPPAPAKPAPRDEHH